MFWLIDKILALIERVFGVIFVKQGDDLFR